MSTRAGVLVVLSVAVCGLAALGGDRIVPAGPPRSTSLAPPEAFVGKGSGCRIPDPSGTGGCVTPAMAWTIAQVASTTGDRPGACWDRHAWNPRSDHPAGRACDYTIGKIGRFPGPRMVARGWELAVWLRANKDALHVNYVIFQGRIWSREHDAEGWRAYQGAGVYNVLDVTGGHWDHLHVSTVD
ncbi:hypothetical protein [Cryptosporangium phraense]|uniref:ARB-07466-like C-terminal domain-containing protein n=1 Tax=Cryptosporangium phraense TaxID=2593070 RepID=A0A545AR16_9ACTN|nr:hypothetical protein [Cryptosporangium phraense]TQS43681.1 hypothetical protein FL583_18810 [Cryptosporangium phraense]